MKEMGLYDELIKMAIGPAEENTGLSRSRPFTPPSKTHLNLGPFFRKSDQPEGYYWFSRILKREDVDSM